MKKIFYLSTCTTCQRIIKDLADYPGDFEKQDIKIEKITESQIDGLKSISGSYESLFSRKAMKFRSMGLGEKELSESDYRQLILEEYTFLKRPVIVDGDRVFIGSSKSVLEELKQHVSKKGPG